MSTCRFNLTSAQSARSGTVPSVYILDFRFHVRYGEFVTLFLRLSSSSLKASPIDDEQNFFPLICGASTVLQSRSAVDWIHMGELTPMLNP